MRIRGWIVLVTLTVFPGAVVAGDAPAAEASDSKALFDRLDANHDGQLTADETPADKRRLFDRLLKAHDRDASGSLSRDEFAAGVERRAPQRMREEKSPAGLGGAGGLPNPEELFARLDANGDGKITASEVPDQARERFEQLLSRADKDNDGVLTRQEVVDGLNSLKQDIQAAVQEIQTPQGMFKHLDASGDGKITSDEVPDGRREGFDKLKGKFDADGDGALNEDEFVKGMTFVRQMQDLGFLPKEPPEAPSGNASDGSSKPSEPAAKKAAERFKGLGGLGAGEPGRMIERFQQMDKNNDGKLSADEFGPRKRIFEMLDANQDGFVDHDEMKAQLGKLRERMKAANP